MTVPCAMQPRFALSCPLLAIAVAASGMQAAEVRNFNIPAGTADKTLKLFTDQSGAEVVYPAEMVRGVRTVAVQGTMTAMDAIKQLLAGSILKVRPQESTRTFIIFREPEQERPDPHAPDGRSRDQRATKFSPPTMKMQNRNPIAAFGAWLVFVAGDPVHAAQANSSASSAPETEEVFKLPPFSVESSASGAWRETNTISATRVNMPLVKIPQPVSVLNAEFIKDIDAFDLDEAVRYVSSVSTSQFAGGIYNVRGWRVGEALRNGVPFLTQIAPVTINMERVEFLKGPASALYSVGEPGGIVNYVTKLPLAQRQTELSTSIDSEGSYRGTVDTTGPLTKDKKLRYRFIGLASHRDGTHQFEFMDEFFVEPSLQWFIRSGDNPTVLTATFTWSKVPDSTLADERWPQVYQTQIVPRPGQPNRRVEMAVGWASGLPEDFNFIGPNAWRKKEGTYFHADLQHQFNEAFSFRMFYNEGRSHDNRQTQFPNFVAGEGQLTPERDGDPNFRVGRTGFYNDNDQWQQVLRADLRFNHDFGWGAFTALAGVQRETQASDTLVIRNHDLPPFPLYNPQPQDWDLGRVPEDYTFLLQDRRGDSQNDKYNLLATAELIDGRLLVLGGASKFDAQYGSQTNIGVRTLSASPGIDQPVNYSYGATFQVVPGVYAFYSFSESSTPASAQFPDSPPWGEGTDFGVRLQYGKISGSLSIFNVERVNIVRQDFTLPLGSQQVLSGREESKGWEMDLFYYPTPELQFVMNYTDMKPVVVRNPSAEITEGRTLDQAYPKTFNFFGKYSPIKGPLAGWFGTVGVNYFGKSLPFGTAEALTLLEQPAYTLVQGGIGYRWETRDRGKWSFVVNVTNAFDKFHLTQSAKPAPLRLFTATMRVRF